MLMKKTTKRLLLSAATLLFAAGTLAQEVLTSIAEIKNLKGNQYFTVSFAPNTVQVLCVQVNGSVSATYLWDGKDGLFLYNSYTPQWPVADLKMGDYVWGTLDGLWEYDLLDVYNADGMLTVGENKPIVPIDITGEELTETEYEKINGYYRLSGDYDAQYGTFTADDGTFFLLSEENISLADIPKENGHGFISAMYWKGNTNYWLSPLEQNFIDYDEPEPDAIEGTKIADGAANGNATTIDGKLAGSWKTLRNGEIYISGGRKYIKNK